MISNSFRVTGSNPEYGKCNPKNLWNCIEIYSANDSVLAKKTLYKRGSWEISYFKHSVSILEIKYLTHISQSSLEHNGNDMLW